MKTLRFQLRFLVFLALISAVWTSSMKGEVSVNQVGNGKPLVVFLGGSEGGYPHISFLVGMSRSLLKL